MSQLPLWFERQFTFDFPVELYPISACVCAERRHAWKSSCAGSLSNSSLVNRKGSGPFRRMPGTCSTLSRSGRRAWMTFLPGRRN